jgi:hypothetical protein
LLANLLSHVVKLPHRAPARSAAEEVERAVKAISCAGEQVEFFRLDGLILLILVDLGSNLYLVAVLIVLHHQEKANHESAEQTTDVRQRVVVLFE